MSTGHGQGMIFCEVCKKKYPGASKAVRCTLAPIIAHLFNISGVFQPTGCFQAQLDMGASLKIGGFTVQVCRVL